MSSCEPPKARPKLVLIAGLQKSGTSLLLRLLVDHTDVAGNPFTAVEGHDFWGNVPSHAPREFPAGTIYASHDGNLGHEIPAAFADERVRRILQHRLSSLHAQTAVIVNKNPYHTVRLPWLKAIFPDSFVVATVRRAVPNVYSLLKKYKRPDELDRRWREDGWYGVKPRRWRTMLCDDPHIQCADQWSAVMRKLWEDRSHVDLFVGYRQLCRNPVATVRQILRAACGNEIECTVTAPRLHCYDDEYRRGAAWRSKNEIPNLSPIPSGAIEFAPFSEAEIAGIQSRCGEIERRFKTTGLE